ncbi:natterin-1-like [Hibiscus syriacus]|uniref:natterin-1-like n=1 Tax=Hibiscus syriacus TaxID=106335 RepID=UPI001923A55D|nr:natterin-1-like [Hibiscus syriacus]
MCNYKETDNQGADVFTTIDWRSFVILPSHVAFKGDNDKYLFLGNDVTAMFGANDIGEPSVPFEIIPTNDGNIRIKSSKTGKFLRNEIMFIMADSDGTTTDDSWTVFRPVKVDEETIALINLGNKQFCMRVPGLDTLGAMATSVTTAARIRVEEPVLTREIYDVIYDFNNARVYDQTVLVVAQNSAANFTDQSSTLDVKLAYTDTKTSSWKTDFSLTLGMKTSIEIGVPLIFDGSIEMSAEVRSGVEWGKSFETSTNLEVVNSVIVPPMTKVTVNLVATKGLCDIPFSFMQRDTLYDGRPVLTEVQGGTYFGSNYYNHKFETRAEDLPPVTKL